MEYAISEHVSLPVCIREMPLWCSGTENLFRDDAPRKEDLKADSQKLNISGPFNIQYLAKNNEIKVIGNLRLLALSRSFPRYLNTILSKPLRGDAGCTL